METANLNLLDASEASTARLEAAGHTIATLPAGRVCGQATAVLGREGVFGDALLGAMRARLETMKEAAK